MIKTTGEEKDILLAEDDHDDVAIFETAMLEMDFPHIIRHAENGEVLFVLLGHKVPYILFLDIDMPCKDGMACITEIRRNRAYDHMPIIMYTAHFADKITEDAYRSGANLYLQKTASFKELVAHLKKVFAIDWKNYLHYPPQDQFVLS